MARAKRQISKTGMYHVILRGAGEEKIFQDEQDHYRFIQVLKDVKKECGFDLYGYCLMSDHLHLLLREREDLMETVFRKIGIRYVSMYNRKYERRGKLFKERYKSEAVEGTHYFVMVLRAMHNHPVKAKITDTPEHYQWSSYGEYMGYPRLCDTRMGLEHFHHHPNGAKEMFRAYHREDNHDICMEHDRGRWWKDEEAIRYIKARFSLWSPMEIQKLEEDRKNEILKALHQEGISYRQLERITGVSIAGVRKACKSDPFVHTQL